MRMLMSPTSSSSTVPPSAISSSPRRSRCASVKLPRVCPNSSDSSSDSGTPGAIDRDHRPPAAVAALMNQMREHFFAGTALTSDQDLRVAWSRIVRFLDDVHHHTTKTEKELSFQ